MTSQNKNNIISAVLMAVLGVLFIVWKSKVISIGMTILGVMLIIQAIIDIFGKHYISCVIKAVIGVVMIIFGWQLVSISLYIMAAVLLIYGVMQLVRAVRLLPNLHTAFSKILIFFSPAVCLVISCLLLFNQGGTVSWVFIISGIFLLIQALLSLLECVFSKK